MNERNLVCFMERLTVGAFVKSVNFGSHAALQTRSVTVCEQAPSCSALPRVHECCVGQ